MEQSGTPSTSSLFKPLQAEDIIIHGEVVRYESRRHWAILVQPFIETLAMLVLVTVLAGTGASGGRYALMIVVLAGGFMVYRATKGDWKQIPLYIFTGLLLLVFLVSNAETVALLVILGATIRFAHKAIMWLFFQKLYITNRRVILAEGLLGSDIATMPLTRVTDIDYKVPFTGELLGYANLRIETAGQDQALSWLRFLQDPATFYSELVSLSTAAVGSIAKTDEDVPAPIITTQERPPPVNPDLHIGTVDEDGGDGTLAP